MDLSVFSSMLSVNGPKGTRREGKKFRQYAAALSSEYPSHTFKYNNINIIIKTLTLFFNFPLFVLPSYDIIIINLKCKDCIPFSTQHSDV